MSQQTILRCQCGAVECHGMGAPFFAAVCYCDHCQEAARQIEASGAGPAVTDPDGGTSLCLIRNDKFTIAKGSELLRPHRRNATSPTSRMVATCCNSAMYLEFSDGRFWKSAMVSRIDGTRPAIAARLCTRYRESSLPWPDEAPRHSGFPISSLLMIARQWFGMKLGR